MRQPGERSHPFTRRRTTMSESTMTPTRRFSSRASLAAVGRRLRQLDLFGPIRSTVTIAQKLYDAFIAMLAGAHGLVEIPVPALYSSQRAPQGWSSPFGHPG